MKIKGTTSHRYPTALRCLFSLVLTVICMFAFTVSAKADQRNTTLSSAAALTPGNSINVTFTDGGTDDYYYKFTMQNGGEFTVTNVCTSADEEDLTADISILSSNQNCVADSCDSQAVFSLTKGTYYLEVSRRYFTYGNFTIGTSAAYAQDAADNMGFSKAASFSLGTPIYGNIGVNGSGYMDLYYKFTMDKGGVVSYSLKSDNVEAVNFCFTNAHEEDVDSNNQAKSGSISLAKGTYYLIISQCQFCGEGNFILETSVDYADTALDNHTLSKASEFIPSSSFEGNIGKDSDDYADSVYKFTMEKGGVLSYSLKSDTIDSADFHILNTKQDDIYLGQGTKSGSVSLTKGTYYLIISAGYLGGDGNFTFDTDADYATDAGDHHSEGTALAITPGKSYIDNLGLGLDGNFYEDCVYKFTLKFASKLKFSLVSDTVQHAGIVIENVNKEEVESFGAVSEASVSLAKGTYYLVISHERYEGDGNFRLNTTVISSMLGTPVLKSVANSTAGVTVTWNKVSGAEKYKVFYKTGSGSWVSAGTTTKTSYVVTGLKSGKTYTFTVRCMSGDAKTYTSSYNKNGKSILYLASPNVTVKKVSGKIQVSWTRITGAKGYYVYRKTANGSWTRVTAITSGSTVLYTDSKAVKNKSNYYAVRAYNGKTYGAYISSKAITG